MNNSHFPESPGPASGSSATAASVAQQVQHAFDALVAASLALDPERYLALIDHDNFTGINADGKAWHSSATLEALVRGGFGAVQRIDDLAFENVKITVLNPMTAILVNEYSQTIVLKDGSEVRQAGAGTQVWSLTAGHWKLSSISASDARQRADAVF